MCSTLSLVIPLSDSQTQGAPISAGRFLNSTDSASALSQEIQLHQQQVNNESVLTHLLSCVWDDGSSNSLKHLQDLQTQTQAAQQRNDTAALAALQKQTDQAVTADKQATSREDTVLGYAAGGLQTLGLFLGKGGRATTAGVYALNNMKWNSSIEDKAVDGLLGAGKGLALRATFNYFGKKDWGPIEQGVGIGFLSRAADVGLSRDTWKDGITSGIGTTLTQAGDWRALAMDGVTFGVAKGLLGMAGPRLEQSVLAKTMATGGVFGFTTGATNEIARESKQNESFSFLNVLNAGLVQGGVDMAASIPGGLQGARSASMVRANESMRTAAGGGDDIVAPTDQTRTAPAPREFVVTDGQDALTRFMDGNRDRTAAMLKVREIMARQQGSAGAGGAVEQELGPERSLFLQHLDDGRNLSAAAAASDLAAFCNPNLVDAAGRANHVFPDARGPVKLSADNDGSRLALTTGDTTVSGYDRSIDLSGTRRGEPRGDAAQRELIQSTLMENGPDNPNIPPEMRPVRALRARVQQVMKDDNMVLLLTGKNSAADMVGMDCIYASRKDGRYFFYDPTLDADSKVGLSELRTRSVINMEMEDGSVDLGSRIDFMQRLLQDAKQPTPFNLRDLKPPSIDSGKTDAEKQAEIERFRGDLAAKIAKLRGPAQPGDTQTQAERLRDANLLEEYDQDIAKALKFASRTASEGADPEYAKRNTAFNQVFDDEVRDLTRSMIAKGGRLDGVNIDADSLRRTGMRLDRQYDNLNMVARGQKFQIDQVTSRITSIVNDLVNRTVTKDYDLKRQMLSGAAIEKIKGALLRRLSLFSPEELFGEPESPPPPSQRNYGRNGNGGQQFRGPR
jgi:hypothetical protein